MTARLPGSIDLNADLGEHDGSGYAADEALLDVVSSVSVACGAHAGSRPVMLHTARSAHARGVIVGAHPSYPDREQFGRQALSMSLDALEESVREQILLLSECCSEAGTAMRYVKPHGALYNRAARDPELAGMLARCIRDIDPGLWVLSLPQSEMESAARAAGLVTAREAFIDRAYQSDGTLVPRDQPGSVLTGAHYLAIRALRIARDGFVETIDGEDFEIGADSLCVHGDSPEALELVLATRALLIEHGFSIRAFV